MTEFQAEGAFLLSAERASAALEQRLRAAHSNVRVFPMSRDELVALSAALARAVAISRAYHLAAAMQPKDEAA